jgi:GTP-binding protein HflX
VIITDTVGFIRDLPPDLIAGFRATLEEIEDADVLLHVADIASPSVEQHIESVRATLRELGLADKPECLILNKCDRLDADEVQTLAQRLGGLPVSAIRRSGLLPMLQHVERLAFPDAASERRDDDPHANGVSAAS